MTLSQANNPPDDRGRNEERLLGLYYYPSEQTVFLSVLCLSFVLYYEAFENKQKPALHKA
jgi:hypothetical protein